MSDLQDRSAPALMGDLVTHVTELIRKEMQLFRAEMSEKSTQVVVAAGSLVAAVAIALTALNVLAAALVAALANAGIGETWAAVIVGVIFALIGFGLASRGIDKLKASSLSPNRTVRSAERDASMVREKL